VHNKWIKGGVGFALDIALDPTTYFGGAIVKGAGKVLGAGGKLGMSGITKFSPEVAKNLTVTGKSIKDAFGQAFVHGYGGSKKGAQIFSDDIGKAMNKLGLEKNEIIGKTVARLSKFDEKTLARATDLMIENRRIEYGVRKGLNTVDNVVDDVIYRGQPKDFKFRRAVADVQSSDNILIGKGVFTTSDINIAKSYGDNISTFKKPTEKILDISNADLDTLKKLGIDDSTIKVYQDTLKSVSPATVLGQSIEFDGKKYKIFRKVDVKG
jgi:hypothetical protein